MLTLRGFLLNVGYGRHDLEMNQQLTMSRDINNKYDKQATVVKTMDGLVVGRVPKALAKPCRIMMDTVDVLSLYLKVSFVKLNATEVNEKNGKRYRGDQPEIRIEYMSDAKSNNKRKTRLVKLAKKRSGIYLIQVVTEKGAENMGEDTEKEGEDWGEDGDHPEDGQDHKRLKTQTNLE